MITRNRTVLTLAVVAMAMLVLTAASANAALVIEEQFIYEAAMLDTLNGGTGFDGPWVATKSHGRDYYVGLTEFADQKPLNDDSGLSFSTLPVAGSALSRFGSAGRTEAHRTISAASQAALTRDNTTIWFSQLFAGPAANRGAMFIFGTQPLNHTDLYTMPAPGSGFGFSIHSPSDGPIGAVAFNNSVDVTIESGVLYTPSPTTAVSLIVGKINWKPNGTPDEYFLFNVTDLSTEPAEATAIASITNLDFDQSAFNQIALCDGTNSVTDEIRFGTSFADVVGVVEKASNPGPEDGAMVETTFVSLSWSPGASAVSHDVYMGDNFDDVNDGTGDTFRGNQGSQYFVAGVIGYAYPDGLVSGTTYYWRIDEVNDADPNSPWKGPVWSFWIPSKNAYEPVPSDGSKFIDTENLTLTWTPGYGSILHTVYFGDDYDTVATATTGGQNQIFTTFSPGPLETEKTYYWRVDELNESQSIHTGDVWSFKTMPDIPIADPNLVGWWKFETGTGNKVIDFSGHDNHGTIVDKALWVPGQFSLALEFLGDNQGHVELPARMVTTASGSVAMWVNTDQAGTGDAYSEGMFWYGTETGGDGFGDENEIHIHNQGSGALGFWMRGTTNVSLDGPMLAGTGWNHVAVTWDRTDGCRLYFNGLQADFQAHTGNIADLAVIRLGRPAGNFRYHDGLLDDVRLFDHAITAEQVNEIMTKGEDPLKAGAPSPGNGSVAALTVAETLTWSAGEGASQHDVYFGADADAVADADTSDTTGTYRGLQSGTTYTPPEGVEWGGGPYYWRIDENNNDGTVTKGKVWTFTVADFVLVDDFEAYNIGDNEIWFAWNDGLGAGTPDVEPYVPGNGTGAMVGDDSTNSYTEETIVHGGKQSMPYWYDNNKQGFNNYSEAKLTLTAPRDWAEEGVAELSLWFRGYPASVSSFVEDPVGTYTMTASGADIWYQADEFHFAYKTLTGIGSIQVQVLSVDNTNVWAKAGVMIRETLEPGSVHATMVVTPAQGVSFQRRTVTDDSSSNTDTGAIVAPYWVKIERDIAGNFTASSSTNGSTWTMQGTPENIPMGSNVYIGLAVTSHDAALTCQAVFSNVTTTGSVSPLWANQDIGITSNAAEPLYVAVSNVAGAPAVVVHDDPAAATIDTWTEWVIPLQAFADQGIVLTNVDGIAIGLGTQGNITIPGGAGKMYFDDIRLYRPRDVAE